MARTCVLEEKLERAHKPAYFAVLSDAAHAVNNHFTQTYSRDAI